MTLISPKYSNLKLNLTVSMTRQLQNFHSNPPPSPLF
jgi:hypothetical protein